MTRVLFVASECLPYIKTGGLADAVRGLAVSLRNLGVDVQLMLPMYSQLKISSLQRRKSIRIPSLPEIGDIYLVNFVDMELGLPFWLVECPEVFDFDCGIYQLSDENSPNQLARRFAVLGWAASQLAIIEYDEWKPDILHLHDWHASLTNVYLSRYGHHLPRTILTIHNLAFQGTFSKTALPLLNLTQNDFAYPSGSDPAYFSFLTEAIARSDKITTVSPNYAKEIMRPEFGCGLDRLLRQRRQDIIGIMNGVDYQIWCPELDPHLPMRHSKFDTRAQSQCRYRLQSEMGLEITQRSPILAFTNRITEQKMIDTILEALPFLMERDIQLVIHGEGDKHFEQALLNAAEEYSSRLAVTIGHSQSLEHLIHAGSDICLSPSRFEPCGLNPLYAIRYGAVPVVRSVGGLVDSIVDVNDLSIARGTANGFMFQGDKSVDLIDAIDRALRYFRDRESWLKIVKNCIKMQFKWQYSAVRYKNLYDSLKQNQSRIEKNLIMNNFLLDIN